MLALMLAAGLRGRDEFAATGVTFLFAAGFSAVTLALAVLYLRMERR
jgi:hypothetical protein